ncbi:Phage tail sheath protein FI [Minicystis rosea]|nr:Phage tail sheath protein FI [Minicystis rosea]
MAGRASRRLPGVRFVAAPPPIDPLPRMDIAILVGFAAEGPLHVPVAVESAAEHGAVFGEDAVVAWDEQRQEPVLAHLGPAVRAFFRNGGRRAWVIRVAGSEASANQFAVSALLRGGPGNTLVPALARARSAGSWSDGLTVGTALLARRALQAKVGRFSPPAIDVTVDAGTELVAGDLLRITFRDAGLVWMVPVVSLARPSASPKDAAPLAPGHPRVFRAWAEGDASFWFRSGPPSAPVPDDLVADVFAGETVARSIVVTDGPTWKDDEARLVLKAKLAEAPVEGAFLRVDLGTEELWMPVRRVRLDGAGGDETIEVSGPGLRYQKAPPSSAVLAALLAQEPVVERLRLDLWARLGDAPPVRLSDLGLGRAHPRFWGALPSDEQLYRDRLADLLPRGAQLTDEHWAELWQAASGVRFPLAGDGRPMAEASCYLPVGMAFTPEAFLGVVNPEIAPVRDGLAKAPASPGALGEAVAFDDIFLDGSLSSEPLSTLLATADFLRDQSPDARPLRGIHAALAIDEATILAAPDLVHRRWHVGPRAVAEDVVGKAEPAPSRARGAFADCRLPLDAPVLVHPVVVDETGTFTLRWTGALDAGEGHVPGERFVVEESASASFASAVVIYDRVEPEVTIRGRSPGAWYYRVRIENAAGAGPWSAWVEVQVTRAVLAVVEDAGSYDVGPLVRAQAAMLRMCAARGDLFALLSLPEHHREAEAVAHPVHLAAELAAEATTALGYGALYHPWLVCRDDVSGTPVRRAPADGAIAGVFARRALARGAWVAPANEPLAAVVALTPSIGRDAFQALQDAQVNLVRQAPGGFLTLAEDTLSTEADFVPIHVRRLLILLRRAALDLGATYVFEPNGGALHRMVQRGFEGLLGQLYARGAFSGRTADAAFQVVAGASAGAMDAGCFSVDLRVAPAAALRFLTVRLVQTGERSQVTEVR